MSEYKSLEKAIDTLDKLGIDIYETVSGLQGTLSDQQSKLLKSLSRQRKLYKKVSRTAPF